MTDHDLIRRQRRRFGTLSIAAIVVSFVHMASALTLYSHTNWYDIAAALAMTALVDVVTWAVAEYLDYARRYRLQRSRWSKVLFAFALMISMFLNGAYLWAYRPATLPEWMNILIVGSFAVFVPLTIAVSSLIRGELTIDHDQSREQEELRNLVAQLTHERDTLRDRCQRLAQERDMLEQTHAHVRDHLAQVEHELALAKSSQRIDVMGIAQKLLELGATKRETAQLLLVPESTLRYRVRKASTNGVHP
jgi:hypothetical protein